MTPVTVSPSHLSCAYTPVRDPRWTPEIEDAFFARLDEASDLHAKHQASAKIKAVRAFGSANLNAQRMGGRYVSTLGAILVKFAEADSQGVECLVSQRDAHLGPPHIIRNIQDQLHTAGLMVKEVRQQGHGFVGEVFVYAPVARHRFQWATVEDLEKIYRSSEGEGQTGQYPDNLICGEVPH